MHGRIGHVIRARSQSLAIAILGMLALGLGIGSSLGIAGVVANHESPGELHACVNRVTGAMRYVTDPSNCTRYEQVVSWNSSGSSDLTFQTRTSIKEVPANAGGQSSNTAYCEDGEIAISGGSRTIYNGDPAFASWVKFDLGGGLVGTPPNGWTQGYSFSNTFPNTSVETSVTCIS